MQWIAMTDRTPDVDGMYIVYAASADSHRPFIRTAIWDSSDTLKWMLVPSWAKAVTHWMPLPKPPVE